MENKVLKGYMVFLAPGSVVRIPAHEVTQICGGLIFHRDDKLVAEFKEWMAYCEAEEIKEKPNLATVHTINSPPGGSA